MRTTTRIPILYVGQLERWTSNLQKKTCPSSFVFVDLDGWALQLVLLIRGVSNFSSRQRLCKQIEVS